MNQDKLDFFLKFAAKHEIIVNAAIRDFNYCSAIKQCIQCVHVSHDDCMPGLIDKKELEYLKLNYPEYFL